MTLRVMTEQDLSELTIIEIATQFSPWSKEIFEKCLLLGSQAWVIEIEQRVIGFVLLFSKVNEGHILNLAVHPDYQRQGYGKLLMKKILAIAEEEALNKIYLEVRHSNRGAIALYKEMGFHPIGVRKNYYRNQDQYEDALVFEKTITKDNG